jgi:hypothetical protein
MTREEKITKIVRQLENCGICTPRYLAESIIDAIERQPADDIPIGAPCEVWDAVSCKKLRYYAGNGKVVLLKQEAKIGEGIKYDHIEPIDIWRIPASKGGAPKLAIARAYDGTWNIWCRYEADVNLFINKGYTIERRPEEE